jgi:hypothetical protein
MTDHLRTRFWIELALAVLSFTALALTLIARDWIEKLNGLDPDNGSGAAEWAIVVILLVTTVATSTLARREWRRAAGAVEG